jgi:Ser-tRNA(Ala) deacylase AlaX
LATGSSTAAAVPVIERPVQVASRKPLARSSSVAEVGHPRPYVEFEGVLDEAEKARAGATLDQRLAEMVDGDEEVVVESTTVSELKAAGVFMPMEIPLDKPTRVVTTFGYQSPCGGTHVKRTAGLYGLHVRGVRSKSGRTRVSYEFANGLDEVIDCPAVCR